MSFMKAFIKVMKLSVGVDTMVILIKMFDSGVVVPNGKFCVGVVENFVDKYNDDDVVVVVILLKRMIKNGIITSSALCDSLIDKMLINSLDKREAISLAFILMKNMFEFNIITSSAFDNIIDKLLTKKFDKQEELSLAYIVLKNMFEFNIIPSEETCNRVVVRVILFDDSDKYILNSKFILDEMIRVGMPESPILKEIKKMVNEALKSSPIFSLMGFYV